MTREELKAYILNTYDIDSDSPWVRDPESEVFRHPENRKWFVLLTNAPVSALAPTATNYRKTQPKCNQTITAINVKVDPVLSGSLRSEPGIYPAYHMNKDKWITVDISVVPDDTIKWLIDMSFSATASKAKKVPKEKKPKKVRNKYPETFFKDLFGAESSDVEYADFLIELLLTRITADADEHDRNQRNLIHSILLEFYKEDKTMVEIAKNHNISSSTVAYNKRKGIQRIRFAVQRDTFLNTKHSLPLTFSEYNEQAKEHQEIMAQHKREREEEQKHLQAKDHLSRLYDLDFDDTMITGIFYKLLHHGIDTIGKFLDLTGCENIPQIGKLRWGTIKKLQEAVKERLG